jgi:Flp pilus assembly protein TadD
MVMLYRLHWKNTEEISLPRDQDTKHMTRIFSPLSLTRSVATALALTVSLSACSHFQQKAQEKDIQRILEEMKGPDVPSVDAALLESGKNAEDARNYASAVQYYKQLSDNKPDNHLYRLHYADNLRRTGQNDDAIAEYKKLLDVKEYQLDAKEGMGLSLMAKGEFDNAGDMLADVMDKDSTRWRTINAIGILFTVKAMYPEARQYFAEALVQSPKNVSVYNNWGLMEAFAEEYAEAIKLLQDASKSSASNDALRKQTELNLALVYAIKGDLDMAEKTARPHLNETQLLNNMGYYAHLADDDVLAKSYLNMALTASDKHYEKAWQNLETLEKLKSNAPKKR